MPRLIDADAVLDRYYAEYEKQDICDGSQDRVCERYSGNGEIVYCVEGPCLDEVIQDET